MKKLLSFLLVLCCLMTSAVPAFADRKPTADGWSASQAIESLKSGLEVLSIFEDCSVEYKNTDTFIASIRCDAMATAKVCYPSAYRDYKALVLQFCTYLSASVQSNYSKYANLSFSFYDSSSGKPVTYLSFCAYLGNYTCQESNVFVGSGNLYVQRGANANTIYALANKYCIFGDDCLVTYSSDTHTYFVEPGSTYCDTLARYCEDGFSSAAFYLSELYKKSFSDFIQVTSSISSSDKIVVLFTDSDGNTLYGLDYSDGSVTGTPLVN